MMKMKLTLFVTVLTVALFGVGCSSLNKGLVAYYPFNGDAKNLISGTEDSTPTGKIGYSQDGKSASFAGEGTWLNAPVPAGITNSSPYSISVMIYPQQPTFGIFHLGDVSRPGGSRTIVCVNGKIRVGGYNEDVATGLKISIGKWQHICVSWDGLRYIVSKMDDDGYSYWNNPSLHKDNPAVRGGNFPALHKSNLSYDKRHNSPPFRADDNWTGLVIGAASHYERRIDYKGLLKDFRIYNRALSTDEVIALYDLEKPKGK